MHRGHSRMVNTDKTERARLTRAHQRLLDLVTVRLLRKRIPSVRRLHDSMRNAAKRRRMTVKDVMQSTKAHVGTTKFSVFEVAALHALQTHLIKARRYSDESPSEICHGCCSFCAQITCPQCHNIRFCMGCVDYGVCWQCSE